MKKAGIGVLVSGATALGLGVLAIVLIAAPNAAMPVAAAQVPPRFPKHINAETDEAIQKGLRWLAQQQGREGFWADSDGGYAAYSVCMTALAGLALSASGSTPSQGPYSQNLSRAVTYLLNSAQDDGTISRGGAESGHSMYGHGFSMLFLAQVYGMEADKDKLKNIHKVLTGAVRLTDRAQSRLGGWYYTPTSNFDEGSVTVTQVQGLRACRNVGIAVPKKVIDDAMKYLKDSSLPQGGIAYRVGMTDPRPPITAAAVVCWYNAGLSDSALCRRNLRFIKETIGPGDPGGQVLGHFFYAHLYMSQAMYLSGDKNWDSYFPKLRDRLLAQQSETGTWTGDGAGEVYGTSLALIILQLPYRYLPIMQR